MDTDITSSEITHWVSELREAVDSVRMAHFRLVWLVGGTPQERSAVLGAVAQELECPDLKIGKKLSGALLDLSPRLRAAAAEEAFQDILLSCGSGILCIDHLEILFDPPLQLNAVELIKNASRRFVLIASWPGSSHDDSLSFGAADHPAYVRVPLDHLAAPLITLS